MIDQARRGREVVNFLKSFEGAAATFAQGEDMWSLWLPEVSAGDHPVTPASQFYFAVILRHEQQMYAIRFFYDCSTGKVRYYTSALPGEVATAPEFENAVSELFRHSLPVEPIRQRKLRRMPVTRRRPSGTDGEGTPPSAQQQPRRRSSLADPVEEAVRLEQARFEGVSRLAPASRLAPPEPMEKREPSVSKPPADDSAKRPAKDRREKDGRAGGTPVARPAEARPAEVRAESSETNALVTVPAGSAVVAREIVPVPAPVTSLSVPAQLAAPTPYPADVGDVPVRKVLIDIGDRLRSVLLAVILVCGVVIALGIVAYTYLTLSEDPGIRHHRMQLEAMKVQRGG